MKHGHLVVQSSDKPAQQLLLLSHDVGDNLVTMGKIGSWFTPLSPDVLTVSIGGAEPYGTASGRQWLSVQGIIEKNRQERANTIMPTFIEAVRYWQKQSSVLPQATALVDLFRGSVMSLESIKAGPGLASRVTAFSSRYATLPEAVTTAATMHLVHGGEDRVIESSHAVAAQEALIHADGDVTLDIIENLGRAIDERSIQFVLDHLHFTVPKHYFDEALNGGKPYDDDVITMIWLITVGRITRGTLPAGA